MLRQLARQLRGIGTQRRSRPFESQAGSSIPGGGGRFGDDVKMYMGHGLMGALPLFSSTLYSVTPVMAMTARQIRGSARPSAAAASSDS